jgi:hypothetical protein
MLSSVYCGYAQGGSGVVEYPMPPSWSQINAGVLDEARGTMVGNLITHDLDKGGYSFKICFRNDQDATDVVAFAADRVTGLDKEMQVAFVNPSTGAVQDAGERQTVTVDAHDSQYRWLAVGTSAYVAAFSRKIMGNPFGFAVVAPNPFRASLRIEYTVPQSGVDKVRFAVINQLGRVVSTMKLDKINSGTNQIIWNPKAGHGRGLAAGVYIIRLSALDNAGKTVSVRQSRVMYLP